MVETAATFFADLLKQHRAAACLTQEELAERAGLSARTVSDLERGINHRPYAHTVQRLVQALRLDEEKAAQFHSAAKGGDGTGDAWREPPGRVVPGISLPIQPTPFVGRQHELEEVRAVLSRQAVRLLTLTGPGGVGKTRLAVQAAEDVAGLFPDGVSFVSLGSLVDPGQVPASIATALGIREVRGPSFLEHLTTHLRSRRLLLVLDNFEHLLPAADAVSHLLASCAQLTILVTSRTVLHLAAEHEYPVPPLTLPIPEHLPELESLARYDAIRLFVQRAKAVKPAFRLTEENASAVAGICYRLDGLPLAIELAAARIKLFPPQALLRRLSSRLTLLTGGARDRPARHQTLRAAIDWSYSLLSEGDRKLFARLSVFVGGCTLEAVEAICTAEGSLAFDVMDGVASLVDKSLLLQEGEQEPRFRILETIREYAAERLEASGSGPALHQKHAMIYLLLVETAASKLHGPQQVEWLRRLELEQDNLRAALQWSSQNQELERGMRLAISLRQFWLARGHRSEGERWLERFLEQADSIGVVVSRDTRARALHALAALALSSDRSAEVVPWLEESIGLSRGVGDTSNTGEALVLLATAVFFQQGDLEQVAALSEESLSVGRELNDRRIIALSLFNLASVAWARHDFTRQRDLLEESVRLLQEVGDLSGMVSPLQIAGWGAFTRGDFERAAQHFAKQRAVCEELGDLPGIVSALYGLGGVARERGEYERAGELFSEGMTVAQRADDKDARGTALLGLGALALDLGDVDRVDVLCTESLAIFRSTGDAILTASSLHALSQAASQRGDYTRAAVLCREALTLSQKAGFEPMTAQMMATLGFIAREQGDMSSAAAWLTESLRRMPPGHHAWWTAAALEWTAGVVSVQGQAWRAARLFGAAAGLRASIGVPISRANRPLYDRDVRDVHAALGDEGFRAAWEEGQAMTVAQAITCALDGLPSTHGTARDVRRSSCDRGGASSLRLRRSQRQAVAIEHLLLAGSLSPRAYASLLRVSVDTALRDLRDLVDRDVVQATGTTRDRRYVLAGEAAGKTIHRTAR